MARQFDLAPVAFAVTEGPTHVLHYANATFHRLVSTGEIDIGQSQPSAEGRSMDLAPLLDRAYGRNEPIRDELIAPPGDSARWSCTIWPIGADASIAAGLVVEIRDVAYSEGAMTRQRAIAERLLLGALREQDLARLAVEAGGRANFLAAASRDLARSLDQDTTRELVQRSVLPRKGTWCIVDIFESNGQIHRLAVVHPDPSKQDLARTLADQWYPPPEDPVDALSLARLADGKPIVITRESGAALIAAAHGAQHLDTLRQLGFGALLVVPLVVRASALGTMTFVTPEGDEPFTPDEIALASDLADRCALALDNARLYRETDALRAAANEANLAKSEFLRNVGHELRTPLYAIGGYVEILQMTAGQSLTPEQRSDLGRIKVNQQHLAKLISQLFNFVRTETGQVEYAFAEVPVEAALRDVADLLDGAIRERRLDLDFRSFDASTMMWADPDRVRQILLNLVMNAVKYTPVGSGSITLDFTVANDRVLIRVEDLGPGIPAEKFEAIFQQFVQLPNGVANRQGGFGLGLGISRDLARAMGGDLTVESTIGVGSRFTLNLPRAKRDLPVK